MSRALAAASLLALLAAASLAPAQGSTKDRVQATPATRQLVPGHLRVAVASYEDPPDALEQDLLRVLSTIPGLMILQPSTPEELFEMLEKLNKNGRKIDLLIFAGHGESRTPHIKMRGVPGQREGGLEPEHVDIFLKRSYYKDRAEALKTKRAAACLAAAQSPSGSERPSSSTAMEKLIQRVAAELPQAQRTLEILETASEVTNAGARVLLLNCSPAHTPAGQEFVLNLGKVLLGRKGGVVRASRSDMTVFEVESLLVSWVTGQKIGEYRIQGDWMDFGIPATRYLTSEKGLAPYLNVHFDPPCLEAAPGARLELEARVDTMRDSGTLTYYWAGASEPSLASRHSLQVAPDAGAELRVPVRVRDARGREGQDVLTILVKKPLLDLTIQGPTQAAVGESVSLTAVAKAGNAAGEEALRRARPEWRVDSAPAGAGSALRPDTSRPGTYRITAELVGADKAVLAAATHRLEVVRRPVIQGYWRLVEVKNEATRVPPHDCYPFTQSGSETSAVYEYRSVCMKPPGRFSMTVNWSRPPETLVPGTQVTLWVEGKISAHDPRLFQGGGGEIGINAAPCGASYLRVEAARVDIGNHPVRLALRKEGSIEVPGNGWGRAIPELGGRLKINGCGSGWAAYYLYAWQEGSPH